MLRRSHGQIFTAFLVVHLVLSLVAGYTVWLLMDGKLKYQALESANAVARMLSGGGFTLNQDVMSRMQELTGYKFTIVQSAEAATPELVYVALDDGSGRTVAIDYRSKGYQENVSVIYWTTLALLLGGIIIFVPVAWFLARRFSRPLELLSVSADQIGLGNWAQPIKALGSEEIQQLSASLEQMRKQLIKLDEENRQAERLATLGTFTATIAHEVRNPLAAIKMMMQLLEKEFPDSRFKFIHDEIERLDLMVDELLGFSAGMKVQLEPCELSDVVRGAINLLQRQADHADVELKQVGNALVLADARRLRQLLINLVLNAIQVQDDGGTVLIEIQVDGFVVIDSGPGVAPDMLPELFNAFASRREQGTGLGLHLAMHIARAHQASLSYERDQRGTCFKLAGLKCP